MPSRPARSTTRSRAAFRDYLGGRLFQGVGLLLQEGETDTARVDEGALAAPTGRDLPF